MKTVFEFTFDKFSEIAASDDNPSKWVTSKKFSLVDHPDIWFCVMYRPSSESNCSGLYVEPLDLGPFATLTAQISLSIKSYSIHDQITRTTKCVFDYKKMNGHGWPTFFTHNIRDQLVCNDSLRLKCQIDVLEMTPNTNISTDRYTFFTWSLNGIATQLRNDAFEWRSQSFQLASREDLEFTLVARHCKESKFVEIHLVPTKCVSKKVQMSFLIWIEEKRTGIRIPTWVKNFTFDFRNPAGRADTKFMLYDELQKSDCSFIQRDCLQFHCQIYHDDSTVVEVKESQISIPMGKNVMKPQPYSMAELDAEIVKIGYQQKWEDQLSISDIWKDVKNPPSCDLSSSLFTLDMLNTPTEVPKNSRIQKSARIWRPPIIQESTTVEMKSLGPVVYYMEEIKDGKKGGHLCEIRSSTDAFMIGALDLSSNSNVFKKIILQTKWDGLHKLVIQFDEKFDSETVKALVNYLKSGDVVKCHSIASELFKMSCELEIPALKSPCVKVMLEKLSTNNVCEILTFAIRNELRTMADKCIDFAARHFGEINKWKEICPENPEFSFSLYETVFHLSIKYQLN